MAQASAAVMLYSSLSTGPKRGEGDRESRQKQAAIVGLGVCHLVICRTWEFIKQRHLWWRRFYTTSCFLTLCLGKWALGTGQQAALIFFLIPYDTNNAIFLLTVIYCARRFVKPG
jgi:hypothetical protein